MNLATGSNFLLTENNILASRLFSDGFRVADGNRGFDYHDRVGIVLHDQLDDRFHRGGVKMLRLAVVICRCGNNDKIGSLISRYSVQCCRQIQFLFRKVFFYIAVLNR